MYGNVQKTKGSAIHWVKAKPTNSIFVGYRSNLTKKETKRKKKQKKKREKEKPEERKRVHSTTRDRPAPQSRYPQLLCCAKPGAQPQALEDIQRN